MRIARIGRLRQNAGLRDWLGQTRLSPNDIILPYFVVEGRGVRKEIPTMPGVHHLSVEKLLEDISGIKGIRAILLFGLPAGKDETGSRAYRDDGIVQRAVSAVKKRFPELIVITDVCLCGYTTHGHCGIIRENPETGIQNTEVRSQKSETGRRKLEAGDRKIEAGSQKPEYRIDNEETVKILAKMALSHARAGADLVAPSAMADGQVRAIRELLDKNGCEHTGILSYSAKYASSFYGPFREALDCAPRFGDRKSYQLDYRNSDEALREIDQDIDEGADIIMIKPSLAYLDVIYRARQKFNVPIAAYNVSGEYSMIKQLAGGDKLREKELALEVLTSIKRAGADLIISYFGKEVIRWLT